MSLTINDICNLMINGYEEKPKTVHTYYDDDCDDTLDSPFGEEYEEDEVDYLENSRRQQRLDSIMDRYPSYNYSGVTINDDLDELEKKAELDDFIMFFI